MSAATVLELDGVTKVYGEDPPVAALRGVSFSIRRGELVAIVGPSGSGKSTLLHVIGTLERPTSGLVRIGGLDAAQLDDRELSQLRAREIGFVFQQFFLAEHSTLLDNVADGLLYAGVAAGKRRERAADALAALGIAIGTAAIVGVLGLSSSSQAGLIAEINRLGTNLLTVETGQSLTGGPAQLPREAAARITLLDHVEQVAHTALIKNTYVYRSSIVPVAETGGLQVRASNLTLLPVLETGLARGDWLNKGTARLPVAVLGAVAAQQLGIDGVYTDQRIWLGGQWFNVAGILNPSPLEPDIDVSVLIGYPAAA